MVPIERLLRMTCTLRTDAGTADTSATWGHRADDPKAYLTGVRCNLQPMNQQSSQEAQRAYVQAAQHELYTLYIEWRADLLAIGGERTYDIVDVVDEVGNVVHAGPLDILMVKDPTGRRSHLEIGCVAKALA